MTNTKKKLPYLNFLKPKFIGFKKIFTRCKFLKKIINIFKIILNKIAKKPSQDNDLHGKESNFLSTLIIAILFAGIIRSFIFEPFHIPSGSMKPTLLVGDYLFVKKYSYGYSRYSFPFSLNLFDGRIFATSPQRGDVAVFRYPRDPSINYIKRIIGLPEDRVQIRLGKVYINDEEISKIIDGNFVDEINGQEIILDQFQETFPSGKKIHTLDLANTNQDNTGIYQVPKNHYFVMGDNRDNSQDSRFLEYVGFVPEENLVGQASIIFFSNSQNFWKFWQWHKSIRFSRIFKNINND
jgi:signal peptidase I